MTLIAFEHRKSDVAAKNREQDPFKRNLKIRRSKYPEM